MQTIKFDLMRPAIGGGKKFIATMKYPQSQVFKFDLNVFYEWLLEKRPSLEGKKIACEFYKGMIIYFNMSDNEIMKYQ